MPVIVVASAKGGPGKTTLACGLGVAAARTGRRVALIDLDPLQVMTRWWELRYKGIPKRGPYAQYNCAFYGRLG